MATSNLISLNMHILRPSQKEAWFSIFGPIKFINLIPAQPSKQTTVFHNENKAMLAKSQIRPRVTWNVNS